MPLSANRFARLEVYRLMYPEIWESDVEKFCSEWAMYRGLEVMAWHAKYDDDDKQLLFQIAWRFYSSRKVQRH